MAAERVAEDRSYLENAMTQACVTLIIITGSRAGLRHTWKLRTHGHVQRISGGVSCPGSSIRMDFAGFVRGRKLPEGEKKHFHKKRLK